MKLCIISHLRFSGRMSKLSDRYWLQTENFFHNTGNNTKKIVKSIPPNVFPYHMSPLGTTTPTL